MINQQQKNTTLLSEKIVAKNEFKRVVKAKNNSKISVEIAIRGANYIPSLSLVINNENDKVEKFITANMDINALITLNKELQNAVKFLQTKKVI